MKISSIQTGQRYNIHKHDGKVTVYRASTPTFYRFAPIYGYFEIRLKSYVPSGAVTREGIIQLGGR